MSNHTPESSPPPSAGSAPDSPSRGPNQASDRKDRPKGRNTKQRQAIREVFEGAGRPLSPQELLDLAQGGAEGISLPTVYRALKAMTASGELTTVDLPGQAPRYELAGLHHHHHFLCEDCGKLFDIPGCPDALHSMAPEGYEVARHELTLIGQCPDCTGSAA